VIPGNGKKSLCKNLVLNLISSKIFLLDFVKKKFDIQR